jgi:hypothetical protein
MWGGRGRVQLAYRGPGVRCIDVGWQPLGRIAAADGIG